MTAEIIHGDCLYIMRTMPDSSVDAIVTDPPYGLGFMGKDWDSTVPPVSIWQECLRVLKPGGHLLSFAGTRTQHRMACAIEDAGFEIRDMIAWVYGSGFPKSLDVSKAIDKHEGAQGAYGRPKTPAHAGWIKRGRMRGEDGHDGYQRPWMDETESVEKNARNYEPATEVAKQWHGWGTALKPALEPITMARKPLTGTVAANVLAHGTGALNVDGCRVGNEGATRKGSKPVGDGHGIYGQGLHGRCEILSLDAGRWPANLIHDGSEEATNPLGSAARFFYCAKATKADRGNGNNHPTVKPKDLMRYLVRLVTPPGGIVLDPFAGSGSTGKAAAMEGFVFIGIEQSAEYCEIARARITAAGGLFA